MKFSYGDIVYHILYARTYPNGIDYLQIMEFDSRKQKYKCFMFDSLAPTSSMIICYIKEEELDFARNVDTSIEKYFTNNGKPLIPTNIDEYYFAVYDFDGLKQKLIRKEIRHKFNDTIPLKKN